MGFSKMSTFAKQPEVGYAVYGQNTEDTNGVLTFVDAGVVIEKATGKLSTFGSAKCATSKKRLVSLPIASGDGLLVNGQTVSGFITWAQSADFSGGTGGFISYDGTNLVIEADKTGVVVIQSGANDVMLLSFAFDLTSKAYPSKVDKGYLAVHLNGQTYQPATDLFGSVFLVKQGKNRDTLTARPDFGLPSENFWVEYPDRATEFSVDNLAVAPVVYTDQPPLVNQIVGNLRVTIIGTPQLASGAISAMRQDGTIASIPVVLTQVSALKANLSRVTIPYYHKSQAVAFDYGGFPQITGLAGVDGKPIEGRQVVFPSLDDPVWKAAGLAGIVPRQLTITVQTADETFQSTLIAILVPYSEDRIAKPSYFSASQPSLVMQTGQAYMVNEEVFLFGQSSEGQTSPFIFEDLTAGSIKISFNPDLASYGVYQTGKWSIYNARLAPMFDPAYTRLVFSLDDKVDLAEFGVKSGKSDVKYFCVADDGNQKPVKTGMITLEVADNVVPGQVIKSATYMALVDASEFTFTVDFVYETMGIVNLAVPGNDDFPDVPKAKQQRSFAGKFACGNFLHSNDSPLAAYDCLISADATVPGCYIGSSTELYPVIAFTDGLGVILTGKASCNFATQVIAADTKMEGASFTKLSACKGIAFREAGLFTSGGLTINHKVGHSLFRLDDTVFLVRSSLQRGVSWGAAASGASSAASSAASTPREGSPNTPMAAQATAAVKVLPAKVVPAVAPKPTAKPAARTATVINLATRQAVPAPQGVQPPAGQPLAVKPSTAQPSAVLLSGVRPSAVQPSAAQPSVVRPSAVQPSYVDPAKIGQPRKAVAKVLPMPATKVSQMAGPMVRRTTVQPQVSNPNGQPLVVNPNGRPKVNPKVDHQAILHRRGL